MIRPLSRMAALGAVAAVLSGCALLKSPDPVQTYRFGGAAPAASATIGTGAVSIALRQAVFPEAVEGDRLLGVTGTETVYIKGARWVSPAEDLYMESLENAFAAQATRVRIVATREALRSIPQSIREAAYALGATRWQLVRHHLLPYSAGGISTGVIIGLSRAIGETAPLLVAAGFTQSLNNSPLEGPMMTLPVFVYRSYVDQGNPASAYVDRAWAGALTLVIIVMALNLAARIIGKIFAPSKG